DIKSIEEIKQPEVPKPEPNEPVVKLPSPDKPKPKPNPPKKVSFKDFKPKTSATNRKTSTNKQPRRNIKIDTIRSSHSSIDSIVTSTTATPSSSYMKDALSDYYKHIYIKAKSNWKIPTINVDALSVKVSFHISKTGIISSVRIMKSSGDKDFDESVIQVFRSITIDPPPDNKAQTINIIFNAS
ncbi:MAG: TonB family protein, partial [Opitutales bacterium]|nr:TonB family protein [Opitutales bacterium]